MCPSCHGLPGARKRNSWRQTPSGISVIENRNGRFAERPNPLGYLLELGFLLVLGIKAEKHHVSNFDRPLRVPLKNRAFFSAAPTHDPRGVQKLATLPSNGADTRRPVTFAARHGFAVPVGHRFNQTAFAGTGSSKERQINRAKRRTLTFED